MRLSTTACAATAAAAILLAGSAVRATTAYGVPFADGNALDVSAVIGTGSNTAYFAVDFNDGTSEAFQYNFDGALGGYDLLTDVEAATTLRDSDQYFASFAEHLVYYVTDGSNTTAEYPALYYSVPAGTAGAFGTSSQGITYDQAGTGIDNVNVTDGEVVAFDNSYSAVPVLPETVPEPASVGGIAVAAAGGLLRRRRRA